ncbi:MAG: SLBB domain-containing protein, partial [Bacteroidota bacterium]
GSMTYSFRLLTLFAALAFVGAEAMAQQTPPGSLPPQTTPAQQYPQGAPAPIPTQTTPPPSGTLDPGQYGRVERTNSNVRNYFFFTQPGEPTIQVYVVGAVVNPGLYEVGPGLDLGRLLALSGGPALTPQQAERRRTTTVKLFRPSSGNRPIFEEDLDDSLTDVRSYPLLREGDTLMVETVEKQRFGWRDLLAVGGALGGIAFFINAVSGDL